MNDWTPIERSEEIWAKGLEKSAEAMRLNVRDWVDMGDYAQAARCHAIAETYQNIADQMRMPRFRRLEQENSK